MKTSIPQHISHLIYLHDCVIIPGFGGFVGSKISARIHTKTGEITPPTKQILFNKNLKNNDGLLVAYIAEKEGITNKESTTLLEEYVLELNEKLKKSKILRIKKIGLFVISEEENIIFTQDNSINYSLDVFGMTHIYSQKEENTRTTNKKIKQNIQTIKINPVFTKQMLKVAAIIIPLFALSYLSISQQNNINTIYLQMANLNPFFTSKNNIEVKTHILDEKTQVDKINKNNKDIKENISALIENKKFYIIGGAFSNKKNADKLNEKINAWHYNGEIIKCGDIFRVSYNSFDNKEDALRALSDIRKENSSAWILTN